MVKKLTISLFAAGLIGGTAIAAQQRGDIAQLRDQLNNPQASQMDKSGESWFTQHVDVNAQLKVDAGLSDTTFESYDDAFVAKSTPLYDGLFPSGGNNSGQLDYLDSNSSDISLAASNVSVDIQATDWASGHIEFTGVDGNDSTAMASVYADEAYILLGNLQKAPIWLSAGRQYAPFYTYEVRPLRRSLPQLMAETNRTLVNLGYIHVDSGISVSGYLFRGMPRVRDNTATNPPDRHAVVNNGGVDLMFSGELSGADVYLSAGWIHNILDGRAFNAQVTSFSGNAPGAVALAAGFGYNNFDLKGGWIKSTTITDLYTQLNTDHSAGGPGTNYIASLSGIKPSAWEIEGGYTFDWMDYMHRVSVGYERSTEMVFFGLPEQRWGVGWSVGLAEDTELELAYQRAIDYPTTVSLGGQLGTGRTSNTGLVRLSVGFL